MNTFADIYNTQEYPTQTGIQFYFVSKGKRDIIKAVQYHYVKQFDGRALFNLGFGDYDLEANKVSDEEVSNNGDQYKVLHTVLATVPRLFSIFGDITLMVQGSDSTPEFILQCRVTCSKKCGDGVCRNTHRRINIYRGFVDKNYEILSQQYHFQGGEGIEDHNVIESYLKGKKYNAVFVTRKKV